MEHHGSTGTVAVCGNCGSCCTLLEIPSAGRLASLGRGFRRQAEHRSSVAHLQNCGCLGVVVQVCLSAECCIFHVLSLETLMVGIWLAARCPLGGLAVGHSESPDELNDWSTSVRSTAEVAIAMRWRCMSAFWKDWCSTQLEPAKTQKEQDKLGLLVPHPKISKDIQRTIQSFQPRKSFLMRWAADSGREVDGGRIDHRETRWIFFEWALNEF